MHPISGKRHPTRTILDNHMLFIHTLREALRRTARFSCIGPARVTCGTVL